VSSLTELTRTKFINLPLIQGRIQRKERVVRSHCEELQVRNIIKSTRNSFQEQKRQKSAHRTGHCIFQAQNLAFHCNSWRGDRTLLQCSESWPVIKFVTNSTKNEFSYMPF